MDSVLDNGKPTMAYRENDFGIRRILSEMQSGNHNDTPCFNTFSGDPIPGKDKVSYAQWTFEVRSAKDHYPEGILKKDSQIIKGCCSKSVEILRPQGQN